MAKYYYGINRGEPVYAASVASATTGKEVEIVVDTAVSDRQSVRIAVENLLNAMLQKNYPPL